VPQLKFAQPTTFAQSSVVLTQVSKNGRVAQAKLLKNPSLRHGCPVPSTSLRTSLAFFWLGRGR